MLSVLSFALLAAGALIALGNWIGMVGWYTKQQKTSLIPVIGGVLGFIGCATHPDLHWAWGFLALGLDPWWFSMIGIPFLLETGWRVIRKRSPTS